MLILFVALIEFTPVQAHGASGHHTDQAAAEAELPPPASTHRGLGLPRPSLRLLKPPRFFYRILLIVLSWEKMSKLGRKPSCGWYQVIRVQGKVTASITVHWGDGGARKGLALPGEAPKPRLTAPSLLGEGLQLGVTWRPVPGDREGSPQPAAQRVHLCLPRQEHQDAACGENQPHRDPLVHAADAALALI